MKRTGKILITFLCLLSILTTTITINAEEVGAYLDHVYVTLGEEDPIDVATEVMEIEGSVFADMNFKVETSYASNVGVYRVFQYDHTTKKSHIISDSSSPVFTVDASRLVADLPVYLCLYNKNKQHIGTQLLAIRVNKGKTAEMIPDGIPSLYSENITVSMEEWLPGMNFVVYPYLIPLSVKSFTDGRYVIGFGVNANDEDFWDAVHKGKATSAPSPQKLENIFKNDAESKQKISGGSMGFLLVIGGWIQGNSYSREPMKGELSVFAGTGFSVTGQYAILTWDVTVTGGGNGVLSFELKYNEEKNQYSEFEAEQFLIGVLAGLELYGGLGLADIASVGIYGAGSIYGANTFYPASKTDHLILSGECGFKIKLLGRNLFSFALVSGSHDFVRGANDTGSYLINFYDQNDLNSVLLKQNYANIPLSISEPETSGDWRTDGADPDNANKFSLKAYEEDPDFAHMIADHINPDNSLQVVRTGSSTLPKTDVVFLGTDPSRINGNRSRLMRFYYLEDRDFISDPDWIIDDAHDDGTADYEPNVYHSERGSFNTYMVWRNGLKAFSDEATLSEIVSNSDLYYTSLSGNPAQERVTYYADSESKLYAAGAKISDNDKGEPVISYYLNSVDDPACLDKTMTHDFYFAQREIVETEKSDDIDSNQGGSVPIDDLIQEDNVPEETENEVPVQDENEENESPEENTIASFFDGIFRRVSAESDDNGKLEWVSRKQFSVTGSITQTDSAYFGSGQCIAVSYTDENDTARLVAYKGDKCIFVRDNAGNAQFVKRGYNSTALIWYEDGDLYMLDENSQVSKLTDDIKIPSSDYQIFGKLGSNSIALVGTVSKDSSENIYAIFSNDGGHTWEKATLTDIAENALVCDVTLAYTYEGDPILFYTVQNYENNFEYDEEGKPINEQFDRSELEGALIGKEDPRFTDTNASLYVKARQANKRVKIDSAVFTDEDNARKGKTTPLEISVENIGLYDIDQITVYADDKAIGTYDVDLKAGAEGTFIAQYPVPSDAKNEALEVKIGVSSHNTRATSPIEDETTATLGTGTLSFNSGHSIISGYEVLDYNAANNGFATKKIHFSFRDEDTGEHIMTEDVMIYPDRPYDGWYNAPTPGAWQLHKNISVTMYEDGEDVNSLPSTRTTIIKGLSDDYFRSAPIIDYGKDEEPAPSPSPRPSPKPQPEPEPIPKNGRIVGLFAHPLTGVE